MIQLKNLLIGLMILIIKNGIVFVIDMNMTNDFVSRDMKRVDDEYGLHNCIKMSQC